MLDLPKGSVQLSKLLVEVPFADDDGWDRRFRAMRETMRASGARLDSLTLISSLKSYSEKGDAYVELIKNVIVVNQLEPLDRARLGERMPSGESGV